MKSCAIKYSEEIEAGKTEKLCIKQILLIFGGTTGKHDLSYNSQFICILPCLLDHVFPFNDQLTKLI